MADETRIVTPNAPRSLSWWDMAKAAFPVSRSMTPEESQVFVNLAHKNSKRLYTEAQMKSEREYAVREFAHFLETTASPKGTVQREKLQSFATEFLSLSIKANGS